MMSVCSGSGVFAHAGVLDGRRATSNKLFFSAITQSASAVAFLIVLGLAVMLSAVVVHPDLPQLVRIVPLAKLAIQFHYTAAAQIR